jgi:hypothetical protein
MPTVEALKYLRLWKAIIYTTPPEIHLNIKVAKYFYSMSSTSIFLVRLFI